MDPSCLLSDEAFARRIAIGLLRDRERAEDLVQEAWLEILEKRPSEVANPRGYLVLLLRRLSFRKRREETRRAAREKASVRVEGQRDTSALVARAEIHGRTVAAVLALDEPYRSTILLRFFEDRTPAEIAAQEGIPVETARTRLKRALAMLRARLESEGRDWREEWAVALAGAGHWPDPEPVERASLPAWGGAAGVVALVLGTWFAWPRQPIRGARAPDAAGNEVVSAAGGRRSTELAPPATRARVELEPEEKSAPPAAPFLSGRVRDELGRPLAGVRVQVVITRFSHANEVSWALSGEDGSFACSLAAWHDLSPPARSLLGLGLEAAKDGRAMLKLGLAPPPDSVLGELDLVMTPGRLLSGRVLVPEGAQSGFTGIMVRTDRSGSGGPHELHTPASSDGWFGFDLEDGERVLAVRAQNVAHGFAAWPEGSFSARTTGDILLPPLTLARKSVLRGRCVHPDGSSVPSLSLQVRQVEPDAAGTYRQLQAPGMGLADCGSRAEVVTDELGRFEAAGLCAGLFQLLEEGKPLAEGAAFEPDGSEIQLVMAHRRLRIVVVDPTGRPLEEARIAVTDLSSAGPSATFRTITVGTPPSAKVAVVPNETLAVLVSVPGCAVLEERFVVPAETFAPELRLQLVPEEHGATLALQPSAGPSGGWRVDLCAPLSGLPIPGWQDLVADAEGRVSGLPSGSYRLRIEPASTATSEACPEWCALGLTEPVRFSRGETSLEFTALPAARLRVLFTGATRTGGPSQMDDLESRYVASTERYAWVGLSLLPHRGRLEIWPLDGAEPLRQVREMKPEAGRFLEVIVPSIPILLSLTLPGREPFEHELLPIPGETLEVPYPLAGAPR